jgi:hypothetical protein
VRAQLIEGKWNLSGAIPHWQILDWNVANGNWEADAYEYAAFSQSIRNLVCQLEAEGKIPSRGEAPQEGKLFS